MTTSAKAHAPNSARTSHVKALEPKIAERDTQLYAGIRKTLGKDELSELAPSVLSEILAFLKAHRISVTGSPLIRYFVVDYNTGEIEIDIGVPVDSTTPEDARVHSAKIPSGSFATVIHRGPYDALAESTAALLHWGQENSVSWAMVEQRKVTRWDGRVEHYVVGTPNEPNPQNWQTEIAILISDAQTLGWQKS